MKQKALWRRLYSPSKYALRQQTPVPKRDLMERGDETGA